MSSIISIPATYYRGGTSKGIFFRLDDLPLPAQTPGAVRDALLLRVLGSPDPYQKQMDGLGNASSSTSKAVILSRSTLPDHDIDYLFAQVAIDKAFVDWSGSCGNLIAAVGAFAIQSGLIDASSLPANGTATLRIWQANIQKTIIVHVPMADGQVQELGDFVLDGIAFPAAEVPIEFMDPADGEGDLFPTGQLREWLDVPDVGRFEVTLINAGIPTVFLRAADIGLTATELQEQVNNDPALLAKLERIRAYGALRMGLIEHIEQAEQRQHTPKIAFIAPPASYHSSAGNLVSADSIDLLVRALSMGKLHHAMMGTAAVAIATAAAIEGTLVCEAAGGQARERVCFGHPSGTLTVGASARCEAGQWRVTKAVMSRSARRIMQGVVFVPAI